MSREYVLQPFAGAETLRIDYAAELNPQQHAAVTAPPGPALVIAGAGSGKTRTLIYRVGYLLEQGVPPERILLLTFTNKAAKEMMRRVGELLGRELPELWGGTFHSLANRVLRTNADRLGYRRDFTILDRDDAEELLDACVGESAIDVKATRFPKAGVLADIFSLAVNTGKAVAEILETHYDYFTLLGPQIEAMRERYQARKKAANAMDFDDLLELWRSLLRDHPDVREHYQRRFQFVLVDEYQDTNHLQGELIDLLAARHRNVMAVGDDAQSIYSWRGADFRNILQFPTRYPGAVTYRIETNYRSTPEILAVANAAIAPNLHQFEKQLVAARESGMRPALVACAGTSEQAAFICQRILELREEGTELQEMAVLYRSHFHALELQLELTRRNIPFSITSGIRFFEQAHIKDVTAYLKLAVNPADELAFKRIAKMLPGVGGKAAEKLWDKFRLAAVGAAAALPLAESPEPGGAVPSPAVALALQACAAAVPKKAAVAWAQLVATMAQLEEPGTRSSPDRMIRLVVEAGYEDYLQEEFPNYRNRLDDLEQMAVFARSFPSPEAFLSELALMTNLEAEPRGAVQDEEMIRLSSIHQAKGLEFEVVFLIMLCEGLFPSKRSREQLETEEEERRLFYVAITRARNELYLSYPLMRFAGESGWTPQQPSSFLAEIPTELVEEWDLTHLRS